MKYGIYLGTNSASIARMENGVPVIIKTNTLKDAMPVCVAFNKKTVLTGQTAYGVFRSEQESTVYRNSNNAYTGFTRTLGTDKSYYSSNANESFTSTELVAEIFKTLCSFVTDDDVKSAVITIPSNYRINQIDAVREAGKLAGIQQVEIIQEPIAVSLAYGLDSIKYQGFSLVFSYKEDAFDVSLFKQGTLVIDTEGDDYLGGKNLDYAIVDSIILPYIEKNYTIDNILSNKATKNNYRDTLTAFAKELKKRLSFKGSYNLFKEDRCGIDDEGEEIELDIEVTKEDITIAIAPIFQKAIDISQNLLKRNNLKGSDLDTLVLVGGDTLTSTLRQMLEEQICKPNTSVDSKTAFVLGASLYASTIDVSDEVREQTRDTTKIQLEIANESSTVEMEEYVPIKILADKTNREIPKKVFAEITREDKVWSSGKQEINTTGEVVEAQLLEGKTNAFDVVLYDEKGNILECEPSSFNIIQGSKIGRATLLYNIGIEINVTGKIIFRTIKGLEKNKSLPAIGTINGIKTKFPIRPGNESDFIKIPIYQGEHNSDGTRAIYNEHVYDIIISGNDLPALLPANSDVDLTINLDKSQKMSIQAFFPYLDHTSEIEIPTDNVQSVETNWLQNEIRKAKGSISELKEDGNSDSKLDEIEKEIEQIEKSFQNNKNDIDTKSKALKDLRKPLKVLDELNDSTEWPKIEKELKEEFARLENANNDLGNEKTTRLVNQLKTQVEEVLQVKDVKLGYIILEEIQAYFTRFNFDINTVEDLLFELTEKGLLSSSDFKLYFEQLSLLKEKMDLDSLSMIYNKLKKYGG